MKRLRFADPLPKLVLGGAKTSTWRIQDEKGIVEGDQLSLCHTNGSEFAQALVISVRETTFGALTKEDKAGHEDFTNDDEMYATYSRYYNMPVTPKTNLKIIKFKLIP